MQMDEGTQQNAALVEQAAAASQAIVEQVISLNTLVSRYKVRGGSGNASRVAAGTEQQARRARERPQRARDEAPAARRMAVGDDAEWTDF
jgi:methyl-accepting chemotaxis protein